MGSAGDPNSFLSGGTVPRDIVASPTKLIVGLNFYCHHEKHLLAIYLQELLYKSELKRFDLYSLEFDFISQMALLCVEIKDR